MENDVKEVLQKIEEKLNDDGIAVLGIPISDDDRKELKKLYRITPLEGNEHRFEKIDQHGHRITKDGETMHDELCWECRRLKSLEST